MAVVMNPKTGEILALALQPTFDPNHGSQAPPEIRKNRAIADTFEPGSTFKIFALAAALEERVAAPKEMFLENGSYLCDITIPQHGAGEIGPSWEEQIPPPQTGLAARPGWTFRGRSRVLWRRPAPGRKWAWPTSVSGREFQPRHCSLPARWPPWPTAGC
jgi:hypothetical protein